MIIIPPQPITVISSNAATSPDPDNPNYMFSSGMTASEFLTTQTENADLLEVEIGFDNCDRVALFNLDAYSVDFELTDNNTSSVVQTKTIDLAISGYDNEYQQWVLTGMHIYDNATLKISINKAGGTVKCGQCGIGLSTYIGDAQWGVQPGYLDYSIKDENDFGQTYLNVGPWAKLQDVDVALNIETLDAVFNDLVNVRGSLVYIDANGGDGTDFESVRLFGFIEDWSISINNPTISYVTMSIQGVI